MTDNGETYSAESIVVCTNGEGYYDHFGLTPLKVRSAQVQVEDETQLPVLFTDMDTGFYGCKTGVSNVYTIGSTEP